ncbi:MAG: zinc ribbon domain-containing protein [Anaerolineales bacterium]
MFFMWIVPLLLIGLVVYTISDNNFAHIFKHAVSGVCPYCNQPAQNDWKVCPHCGQAL